MISNTSLHGSEINRTPRLLKRVCNIVRELSGVHPASISMLSARTGLPRATVHRLLRALEDEGVVTRSEGGYCLKTDLAGNAAVSGAGDVLTDRARPLMLEVFGQTHLLIQLMVLEGEFVRCVDLFDVARSSTPTSGRGGRWLATHVAAGRALLAHCRNHAPAPFRDSPVMIDRGATQPGLVTVAVSLGFTNGTPAAISVSGTLQDVSIHRVTMLLRRLVRGGDLQQEGGRAS
ncbi:helix-turn-helix domain-containing protein [Lentzea sp. NPDC051208]|uniref:helix-turn-helix domain-containing protein n=1 Tax=Lentzea sp. NPDC051208 TaxID=3154642 RepID=UPI00341E65FB